MLAAQIPSKSYQNLNNKKTARNAIKNFVINTLKPTAKKQTKNVIYNGLCSEIFCKIF